MIDQLVGSGLTRAMVILAHPDDEARLCGGTIAELTRIDVETTVVCFSDGAQGRDEAFKQVCTLLGAQSRLLKFETGSMRVDAELVGATDDLIRESEPQLVITHARSGIQNQDHIALHDAVRLSTRRWPSPAIVLGVEPPISSSDFDGNVFCEVGQSWASKVAAVTAYQNLLDRPYMCEEYLQTRASWWAQVAGQPGALMEAFELAVWRPAGACGVHG